MRGRRKINVLKGVGEFLRMVSIALNITDCYFGGTQNLLNFEAELHGCR